MSGGGSGSGKKSNTGIGFVDDLIDNPVGAITNAAVNVATVGLAGTKNGKFDIRSGALTHPLDEGLGEITGRNLARDQAAAADARLNAADAQKQQDILDQQKVDEQNDINASYAARAARRTATAQTAGSLGASTPDYTPAQDFLGL